ncbi:MAG: hypothetical protein F9K23_12275 [Bacteroidetes bacterium]|nr:MAG: hypothetical protein F9K23_17055 [Bacteroidota bacterium]KAB2914898.1 MAG: hypothetical protein F9K23_12275 [Bacteroidota bacterium]
MFDKQLTLKQAIGIVVSAVTLCGGAWVDMKISVARQDNAISETERRLEDTRRTEEEHYRELKHSNQAIYDKLIEIQVSLQNKQDRP